MRRCSSLRTEVRCVLSPCLARPAGHAQAHSTAVCRMMRCWLCTTSACTAVKTLPTMCAQRKARTCSMNSSDNTLASSAPGRNRAETGAIFVREAWRTASRACYRLHSPSDSRRRCRWCSRGHGHARLVAQPCRSRQTPHRHLGQVLAPQLRSSAQPAKCARSLPGHSCSKL